MVVPIHKPALDTDIDLDLANSCNCYCCPTIKSRTPPKTDTASPKLSPTSWGRIFSKSDAKNVSDSPIAEDKHSAVERAQEKTDKQYKSHFSFKDFK